MESSGTVASSLTSGGCSGFNPKSLCIHDMYPAYMWLHSSQVSELASATREYWKMKSARKQTTPHTIRARRTVPSGFKSHNNTRNSR